MRTGIVRVFLLTIVNAYDLYALAQEKKARKKAYILYAYEMATAATIPVRLSDDILTRLDAYAKSLGIKRSEAIRLCLAYQLGTIQTADPKELNRLDGRSQRYTKTTVEVRSGESPRHSPKPPKEVLRLPPGELARLEREEQKAKEKKTGEAPKKKKAV